MLGDVSPWKIPDSHDFTPGHRRVKREREEALVSPGFFTVDSSQEGRETLGAALDALFVARMGRENGALSPSTLVGVSINSWESTTRTIGCVSPKPGAGAGSGPEILNDRASSAASSLAHRNPHVCTTEFVSRVLYYFTGPAYTSILARLWCLCVYN